MKVFLASLALALACACTAAAQTSRQDAAPVTVVIDADTANEIDDLYAIVRALLEPRFRVVGLSSAQWNHRLSPPDTVLRSQAINQDLVRLLNRRDIPLPHGAEMIMGKPWGGREPSDSAAAQFIIRAARAMPRGEKLRVLSLGATTNLASAIALAPDIVPKLSCYMLAGRYYADRRVWDKDEFNVRNDLNATNLLFDTEGLELHVMPVNILADFKFEQKATVAALSGRGEVWDYLANRWLSFAPGHGQWIMWDLALVEALARPELASESEVDTPPENARRKVFAYTRVDANGMQADWWETARRAQARR
jgi:inosine-uridine nucleoside N-ribohydrolase